MTDNEIVPGQLGRRPPSNAPALRLADVLRAMPAHPVTRDYTDVVSDYGLYANDRYGDCGPVSAANSLKIVSEIAADEFSASLDDVLDLYRRSGNPNFPTDDNGVVMQDMLDALLRGGIAGRKPLAFAKVDVSNQDELRAAIAYFGVVLLGVDLQVAQQSQTSRALWDYVPSDEWGGHAVMCAGYNNPTDEFRVVTWGKAIHATERFMLHQLDEAWVVVWPEHLAHPAFLEGVDVAALASAYTALTGREFPAVVPPQPSPTPAPPAPQGAACFPGATAAVDRKVRALAARRHMTTTEYLNFFLTALFHLTDGEPTLGDAAWISALMREAVMEER